LSAQREKDVEQVLNERISKIFFMEE